MAEALAEGHLGCVGQLFGEALADAVAKRRKKQAQAVFTGGHEVRMHCSAWRPTESPEWSPDLPR